MVRASFFILSLLACNEAPNPCVEQGNTWERTAQPFLTTWCTPCHSASLLEAERLGAPLGVDYDTYEAVTAAASAIRARIAADPPTMPPSGGLPLSDRDTFVAWLDCGLPREAPSPPSSAGCESPITVSASSPCASAEAVRVEGSLTTDDDLSCVCEVTGDLSVNADLTLDQLTHVGGTLRIGPGTSHVSLPALTNVSRLEIEAPELDSLSLERLSHVHGDVRVLACATSRLGFDAIRRIDGALEVRNSGQIETIRTDRLEHIGQDAVFADLPALRRVLTTHGVEHIGGRLVFESLPSLVWLDGWSVLAELGGDLRIVGTGMTQLRGFDRLRRITGGVTVSNNVLLTTFIGLPDLEHIGGGLELRQNDALETIDSLVFLESVDGDLLIEDNARLEALPGFIGFRRVGGDLRIVSNPVLSTPDIQAFSDAIEVGGMIEIRDNGP